MTKEASNRNNSIFTLEDIDAIRLQVIHSLLSNNPNPNTNTGNTKKCYDLNALIEVLRTCPWVHL